MKRKSAISLAAIPLLLLTACSSPSADSGQENVPEPVVQEASEAPSEAWDPEEIGFDTVAEAREFFEQHNVEIVYDHPDFGDLVDETDIANYADNFAIPEDGIKYSSDLTTATIKTIASDSFAKRFLPFRITCQQGVNYAQYIEYWTLEEVWEEMTDREDFEGCIVEQTGAQWKPDEKQEELIEFSRQGMNQPAEEAWAQIVEHCAEGYYDNPDDWMFVRNDYALVASSKLCPEAPHGDELKQWLKDNPRT